jgi:hypothetical protein
MTVLSVTAQFGLQIDSSTGKYNTSSLTAEILLVAIEKILIRSEDST